MRRQSFSLARSLSTLWSAAWSTVGGFFGVGGYAATDPRRKIIPQGLRPRNATANELLTASLSGLRAYCRHLERNNPVARAAVEGLVANVVGTGIDLEPDTGDERIDAKIRPVWKEFIASCSVNPEHGMFYLQSLAFREVVVSGEFLWRLVVLPERIDEGLLPLAVLPLEAEWLDEHANTVGRPDENGLTWIGGVGMDRLGRGRFYRVRNPELPTQEPEMLSSKEIIHDFERRRSLQARGEPWFAPVVETLQQERDLIDAELKSAVNTSAMAMVITAQAHDALDTTEDGTVDDPAQSIRLGSVGRLFPGEDIKAFSHTRPSQQIAPFCQMLRGTNAAALRCPQRFLDRDVSRANYSSMRADMLDNDRLLSPVREWFGHATAGRIYRAALPYLALKAGIQTPRPTYRLIPDGQPYVDPEKDVRAALLAIAGGLSTWEREIGKRGEDSRKLIEQLKIEIQDPLLEQVFMANLNAQGSAAPENSDGGDPKQINDVAQEDA